MKRSIGGSLDSGGGVVVVTRAGDRLRLLLSAPPPSSEVPRDRPDAKVASRPVLAYRAVN